MLDTSWDRRAIKQGTSCIWVGAEPVREFVRNLMVITSLNIFLLSLWPQTLTFKSSSIKQDVYFANHGPIRGESGPVQLWGIGPLCENRSLCMVSTPLLKVCVCVHPAQQLSGCAQKLRWVHSSLVIYRSCFHFVVCANKNMLPLQPQGETLDHFPYSEKSLYIDVERRVSGTLSHHHLCRTHCPPPQRESCICDNETCDITKALLLTGPEGCYWGLNQNIWTNLTGSQVDRKATEQNLRSPDVDPKAQSSSRHILKGNAARKSRRHLL